MIKLVKYSSQEEEETSTVMVDNKDLSNTYLWEDSRKQIELLNSSKYKGYSNWRLPSKEELNAIYLDRHIIGGFSNYYYWSSSEYSAIFAWYQYFFNGYQHFYYKYATYYVRCVRSL